MTETSALQALIVRHELDRDFDMAKYHAALQSDWERGDPETIDEMGRDGSGGKIRNRGFEGHVGTIRFDKTPLSDFRSIRRNESPTWREVFARDVDGKVWHVGKLKRLRQLDLMRLPHPNQVAIDAAAAEALTTEVA